MKKISFTKRIDDYKFEGEGTVSIHGDGSIDIINPYDSYTSFEIDELQEIIKRAKKHQKDYEEYVKTK